MSRDVLNGDYGGRLVYIQTWKWVEFPKKYFNAHARSIVRVVVFCFVFSWIFRLVLLLYRLQWH